MTGELVLLKRVMRAKERKQEEAWLNVAISNKVLGRSEYSRQPQWLFNTCIIRLSSWEKGEEGFNPLVCLQTKYSCALYNE